MSARAPYRVIAIRSVGETAWTPMPNATIAPEAAWVMHAAERVETRVRPNGGKEVLEVREP